KEEDVIRHQPTPCPHFGGEEVGGHEHIHMCADKLLPGRRLLTLWGRWNAAALEDIAHRLITDRVAQMGQSAGNTVIAPGAILLGHPHDESFQLLTYRRSA